MDFDARRTDIGNWVLPVKGLCKCGQVLMSLGALFPLPTPIYTIQKSVCKHILPGAVEEASAFFSHGPPIAAFLCSAISEQGSAHGSCSIFGGQCLLNLHSCHARWFPRLDSPRICKFPGFSPEF